MRSIQDLPQTTVQETRAQLIADARELQRAYQEQSPGVKLTGNDVDMNSRIIGCALLRELEERLGTGLPPVKEEITERIASTQGLLPDHRTLLTALAVLALEKVSALEKGLDQLEHIFDCSRTDAQFSRLFLERISPAGESPSATLSFHPSHVSILLHDRKDMALFTSARNSIGLASRRNVTLQDFQSLRVDLAFSVDDDDRQDTERHENQHIRFRKLNDLDATEEQLPLARAEQDLLSCLADVDTPENDLQAAMGDYLYYSCMTDAKDEILSRSFDSMDASTWKRSYLDVYLEGALRRMESLPTPVQHGEAFLRTRIHLLRPESVKASFDNTRDRLQADISNATAFMEDLCEAYPVALGESLLRDMTDLLAVDRLDKWPRTIGRLARYYERWLAETAEYVSQKGDQALSLVRSTRIGNGDVALVSVYYSPESHRDQYPTVDIVSTQIKAAFQGFDRLQAKMGELTHFSLDALLAGPDPRAAARKDADDLLLLIQHSVPIWVSRLAQERRDM